MTVTNNPEKDIKNRLKLAKPLFAECIEAHEVLILFSSDDFEATWFHHPETWAANIETIGCIEVIGLHYTMEAIVAYLTVEQLPISQE